MRESRFSVEFFVSRGTEMKKGVEELCCLSQISGNEFSTDIRVGRGGRELHDFLSEDFVSECRNFS